MFGPGRRSLTAQVMTPVPKRASPDMVREAGFAPAISTLSRWRLGCLPTRAWHARRDLNSLMLWVKTRGLDHFVFGHTGAATENRTRDSSLPRMRVPTSTIAANLWPGRSTTGSSLRRSPDVGTASNAAVLLRGLRPEKVSWSLKRESNSRHLVGSQKLYH